MLSLSFFTAVSQAPPVEVFALTEDCKDDPDKHKVNLSVGAYRTNEGQPLVLPVVKAVEIMLASDELLNKEYLPITGLPSFCTSALKLLLGEDNPLIFSKQADGCQTLGGTGAVYLGLSFMHKILNVKLVYVSNPTWPNHKGISKLVGLQIREYHYWDPATRSVYFEKLIKDLEDAPPESVVILHAVAHNPTGTDLTHEQWKQVASTMKAKSLFPFFDIAYQGFATGDLDNDAWAVRYFASQGFEMFVAQSFSKNFGLYNERVGNLAFITNDANVTSRVKSQLKILIRQTWSNPPQHGARIVATILESPSLTEEWRGTVKMMANRIRQMRRQLFEKLRTLDTPGDWTHLVTQIGMFSYTGLTTPQAEYMRRQHHIYLMNDGRINMCGLTTHNMDYIAEAIHDTICNVRN